MVGRGLALACLLGRCVWAAARSPPRAWCESLEVVSNRADLISGGDALVSATLAENAAGVRVDVDGVDVTSAFGVRPNGRYEGLVTGLKLGANTLTVRGADGGGKRITITNHPIGGPVFAGPQVTPYACNPNVSNPPLGPALDAQCNAPTRIELLYRNAANQFVPVRPGQPAGRRPDHDHGRRQARSRSSSSA